MAPIEFFVAGKPQPAGSKRAFPIRRGGGKLGVAVTDSNPASKDWKTTVAWTARAHYSGEILRGPLSVRFVFVLERPKAHRNGKGLLKAWAPMRSITKPDVLKLARGVEDALTGQIWVDDSQIAVEMLEKLYGDAPGVHVTVTEL